MAHATYVAKAQKNYKAEGIKKGEPYWWWSFRSPRGKGGGGKIRSKTKPRRSQLTKSDFYSVLYDIEDRANDLNASGYDSVSSFEADVESIKSDLDQLKSDTEEKLGNMPEGLQQGDTGQLLQERIDGVESLISDLDGLDSSEPEIEDAGGEEVEKRVQELIDEIQGFNWGI